MDIKVWRESDAAQPKFPADFKVAKKAVLQVTDLVTNRNKYYAIEIHDAKGKYRVFTHYGRTDDLETNPKAGCRESRYCDSSSQAESVYADIYKEKTSKRKGYKEVDLASSKIGSHKSHGQSSGTVDEKTLKKIADKTPPGKPKKSSLAPAVSKLVEFLYNEAVNSLTTTVNATITANGIETPLGVLTLGQIDKGASVLTQLAAIIGTAKGKNIAKKWEDDIVRLSGEFYTVIPHRIGRSRDGLSEHWITTIDKIKEKEDTLQLMRDMLNVNGDTNVLLDPEIDKKYKALNCTIEAMDTNGKDFKSMKSYIEKSQVDTDTIKVKNLWRISRPVEASTFAAKVGNEKLLFHGSASRNWVGILSRGLLLPKAVVKLGVKRTDAGWLGNGIYFGNAICTSYGYAGGNSMETCFITVANVALGKIKKFSKITYGLDSPPIGYDSCHGVAGTGFSADEFVVYNHNQQKLVYLAECSGY